MNRLDRFLLSENIVNEWKVKGKWVARRELSYHFPIWSKSCMSDWGPKPIRFNNYWLNNTNLHIFLSREWNLIEVVGRDDFILYEKLKRLKVRLKWWNKEVFRSYDSKVKDKVVELNDLDRLLIERRGGYIDNIVKGRIKVYADLWTKIRVKENMLRLKSRQLWLKDGDQNTRFFHYF